MTATVTHVGQAKRTRKTRKVSVRITDTGYDHIAQRAHRADITTSHMHRRMLDFAARHMPANYVPPRDQ